MERKDEEIAKKALSIGKVSAKGSFQLFVAQTTSTIIMAVGSIILARLILPEEYGLYAIALIPILTMNLFYDWGIGAAMTKYVAQYRATNKEDEVRDIVAAGLIFKTTIGLGLSLLSVFLANYVATTILMRPESAALISVASIAIISESLFTACQSNFVGFERMDLSGLTMVVQAVVKSTVSPILILLGYGALGAVLGSTFSWLVAALLGLLILYAFLFKKIRSTRSGQPRKTRAIKAMLRFGVPLSISTMLGGILSRFYGFMMAFYCTDTMVGNYQVAVNFAILLTFFSVPVSTVLFPTFAKLDPRNEPELIKTVFTSFVKYVGLLLVPATMAIMVLSKPMISTIYGEKWIYAPFFLALYIIPFLLIIFGDAAMSGLLAGLGQTRTLMKMSILTLLCGVPLAFILIPAFGIAGVILGRILADMPSLLFGLHWVWKSYGTRANFKISARIVLASLIAAIICYVSISLLNTAEWIRLAAGTAVFLATYTVAAPSIKAINQSDINNLKMMFAGTGWVSELLEIPLTLMERIAQRVDTDS